MTVRSIVDQIIKKTGVIPLPEDKTCDQLIIGSWEMEVTGIGTTFMATMDVLKAAVAAGVNLIITHEPTWYTGHERTDWLEEDTIYHQKKAFIEGHGLTLWRFHDHMHMAAEDGIFRGVLKDLQFTDFVLPSNKICVEVENMTVKDLCEHVKETLNVKAIRLVGNLEDPVKRIGLFIGGFSLGFGSEESPMNLIKNENLDAVICGDILEWTLCPYIRDANSLGQKKAMLVIGHERSEASGMKHLVDWLKEDIKEMPIVYLNTKEPFDYI